MFNSTSKKFLSHVDSLNLESLTTQYSFVEDDQFKKLLMVSPRSAANVYWHEIFARAHSGAVVSILRSRRWAYGMTTAANDGNALLFAAAFRGLVESAADSSTTFISIPLTLAEQASYIAPALAGKSAEIAINRELEDLLIHFLFARRLDKGEKENLPNSHQALQIRQYIEILEKGGVSSVVECYKELCDFTHPGASSVGTFIIQDQGSDFSLMNREKDLLLHWESKYASTFTELLMFAFNPALLTLRVINDFPVSEFHVPKLNAWAFSDVGAWQKISAALRQNHSNKDKRLKVIK
ncbi:hypothetical protein Ga0123462_0840 [Mariprofundus ferrinatatus]|uniref:Uncharacterized protein n=1 Tax=Mariprofundus ferrinatatus TaxID=1921087 RepID=A0A2K8L633_9PROT|nr:hypothetical protein [Mariprofundus ferrinatatus]ATX81709.1 hypothetical protein Ga0123462_0840 [Mariprofundus ferrinatatus]